MPYDMSAMQEKWNWCWAAVSYNVDHYYSESSNWTQCRIAREVLKRTECCSDPRTYNKCDQPAFLQDALTLVGCRYSDDGPLLYETIDAEIKAERPICALVEWNDGGGHYVIIAGCRTLASGLQQLWILDPLWGPGMCSYWGFRSAYLGCGAWTHSFLMA